MFSFNNSTIIIGICGVTCGGKTTLANAVLKAFPHHAVACVSQDDYFFKKNDPRHTWIKELNHVNFDKVSSMDMQKMEKDVLTILGEQRNIKQANDARVGTKAATSIGDTAVSLRNGFITDNSQLIKQISDLLSECNVKLLITEGFCIFNYPPIAALCDIKFYFTLSKEECMKRRNTRLYDPPDCPGYFEICAWPEHIIQFEEVKETVEDIIYFNEDSKDTFHEVLLNLYKKLKCLN